MDNKQAIHLLTVAYEAYFNIPYEDGLKMAVVANKHFKIIDLANKLTDNLNIEYSEAMDIAERFVSEDK